MVHTRVCVCVCVFVFEYVCCVHIEVVLKLVPCVRLEGEDLEREKEKDLLRNNAQDGGV
jgi:hypothetical protein